MCDETSKQTLHRLGTRRRSHLKVGKHLQNGNGKRDSNLTTNDPSNKVSCDPFNHGHKTRPQGVGEAEGGLKRGKGEGVLHETLKRRGLRVCGGGNKHN